MDFLKFQKVEGFLRRWRVRLKIFLNRVVDRGYLPVIKPRKIKAGGYGARIRDRVFDRKKYRRRGICEGFFGALTNWFGDKIPCFLRETTITRILLRVLCYALRILLRVRIKEVGY